MTTTRPPRAVNTPRRALFFTIGLLAAMLAAAYADSREVIPLALADQVAPEGWRIRFAPPKGWTDLGETLGPLAGRFRTYKQTGDARQMSVGRLTVPADRTIEDVCRDVLNLNDANLLSLMGATREVRVVQKDCGGWPAIQLEWTPSLMGEYFGQHVYLLGVMVPQGLSEQASVGAPGKPAVTDKREAYIIEFRSRPPLREKDAKLWDMILAAVVTQAGPT